jgi:hypothetical protein
MDTQSNSDSKQDSSELPIRQIHRCQGTTKKGHQCLVRITTNNNYCSRHAKLFKFPKPEECPVCLDPGESMPQPLSCGHWVCRKCITKWKAECPICRVPIQVTKRERQQIESMPTERNESDDLTAQAISSLLGGASIQETDEYQLPGQMDVFEDDTGDLDLFTAFVLAHMNGIGIQNLLVR